MDTHIAPLAGESLPAMNEPGGRCSAPGPDSSTHHSSHSAPNSTADQHRKRVATAQARAALAGVVLHDIEGDDGRRVYIASRWALTRSFAEIEDVERWLDRVCGNTA